MLVALASHDLSRASAVPRPNPETDNRGQRTLLYKTEMFSDPFFAKQLHAVVKEFLLHVDVLPWNGATAERYATIRAGMKRPGKSLGALDLLIAAHASDVGAALVTNDRAFGRIAGLQVEDWTI